MPDQQFVAIIGLLTLIVNGAMAYLMARLNKKADTQADRAAAAVEAVREVKDTLQTTTSQSTKQMTELAKVSKDTHTLVNANMGAQLKISAVALRRIAELTGHQDDIAAAVLAEELLSEHVKKQAVVDSGDRRVRARSARGRATP